jgi:hypothetical protein
MPVSGSDFGFTTVAQGRDKLSAVLAGKRMLVAVDNVAECGPLDALTGLASCCTVLFTTRVPGLAATFGATPIPVDELTQGQALDLLGRCPARPPAQLPDACWGGWRWARSTPRSSRSAPGPQMRTAAPANNAPGIASMGCMGLLVGLAGCRLARWGSPGAVSERGARGWAGDPDA